MLSLQIDPDYHRDSAVSETQALRSIGTPPVRKTFSVRNMAAGGMLASIALVTTLTFGGGFGTHQPMPAPPVAEAAIAPVKPVGVPVAIAPDALAALASSKAPPVNVDTKPTGSIATDQPAPTVKHAKAPRKRLVKAPKPDKANRLAAKAKPAVAGTASAQAKIKTQ